MEGQDDFLTAVTIRLAALIEDQERLLAVIRREPTELIRVGSNIPTQPSASPTRTELHAAKRCAVMVS